MERRCGGGQGGVLYLHEATRPSGRENEVESGAWWSDPRRPGWMLPTKREGHRFLSPRSCPGMRGTRPSCRQEKKFMLLLGELLHHQILPALFFRSLSSPVKRSIKLEELRWSGRYKRIWEEWRSVWGVNASLHRSGEGFCHDWVWIQWLLFCCQQNRLSRTKMRERHR